MVKVLIFIVGLVIGFIAANYVNKPKMTEGVLKVRNDEGESYLFLELTEQNLSNIHELDYVTLRVDIPRK